MLNVVKVGKKYGRTEALSDVTFELSPGSVTAVIGANGAGKTTLIKCIIGLVKFDGEVRIDGVDVRRHGKDARRLLGYLPQEQSLHDDLTVAETARFYAELKGVDSERAVAAIARAGLAEHASKKVSELSGGMRQRLALGVTLLADPPLVILDEPAAGLDIHARIDLRALVREQRAAGKAVLLSTHWIEDVPYIADRVLVLDEGRVVFHGPAELLSASDAPASRLYLRLNGQRDDAARLIRKSGLGELVEQTGDWVVVKCPAPEKAKVVDLVTSAGIAVLDFRVEEASINDAIDRLQKGKRQ